MSPAREEGIGCETCLFASERLNYDNYRCQRNAPTVLTVEPHVDTRRHLPIWPVMKGNDWCGDYKLKAN